MPQDPQRGNGAGQSTGTSVAARGRRRRPAFPIVAVEGVPGDGTVGEGLFYRVIGQDVAPGAVSVAVCSHDAGYVSFRGNALMEPASLIWDLTNAKQSLGIRRSSVDKWMKVIVRAVLDELGEVEARRTGIPLPDPIKTPTPGYPKIYPRRPAARVRHSDGLPRSLSIEERWEFLTRALMSEPEDYVPMFIGLVFIHAFDHFTAALGESDVKCTPRLADSLDRKIRDFLRHALC